MTDPTWVFEGNWGELTEEEITWELDQAETHMDIDYWYDTDEHRNAGQPGDHARHLIRYDSLGRWAWNE